jgi:hypothetical protein
MGYTESNRKTIRGEVSFVPFLLITEVRESPQLASTAASVYSRIKTSDQTVFFLSNNALRLMGRKLCESR